MLFKSFNLFGLMILLILSLTNCKLNKQLGAGPGMTGTGGGAGTGSCHLLTRRSCEDSINCYWSYTSNICSPNY